MILLEDSRMPVHPVLQSYPKMSIILVPPFYSLIELQFLNSKLKVTFLTTFLSSNFGFPSSPMTKSSTLFQGFWFLSDKTSSFLLRASFPCLIVLIFSTSAPLKTGLKTSGLFCFCSLLTLWQMIRFFFSSSSSPSSFGWTASWTESEMDSQSNSVIMLYSKKEKRKKRKKRKREKEEEKEEFF